MPDLDWDEQDFLEGVGVLPQVEEYETEHVYQLTQSGIALTVTVWKHESTIEVALERSETKQPITKLTLSVRGRVHCRMEKQRTSLIFPDCVLVPSRFYLAHEWNFAETHPGMDVVVQIFPEVSLTVREAEYRRQQAAHIPINLWKRTEALAAYGAAFAFAEFVFLMLFSRLSQNNQADGLAVFCFLNVGVFVYLLFQRRIRL